MLFLLEYYFGSVEEFSIFSFRMIDLLILMIVVVGLSLAVYHIAQYSTKETSYEQAIEQQRQKRDSVITGASIKQEKNDKIQKKLKVRIFIIMNITLYIIMNIVILLCRSRK